MITKVLLQNVFNKFIPTKENFQEENIERVLQAENTEWYIEDYNNNVEQTRLYNEYSFRFDSKSPVVTVCMPNAETGVGIWDLTTDEDRHHSLQLFLGYANPLDKLFSFWQIEKISNEIIKLKRIIESKRSEYMIIKKKNISLC